MRRIWMISLLAGLVLLGGTAPTPALAQAPQKQGDPPQGLTMFTSYPARLAELGETVNFDLTLRDSTSAEIVRLDVKDAPEGWTATFRGGGDIIQAVYVEPGKDASVNLRLKPPEDVSGGTYRFVVLARGEDTTVELPIELTVKEKLPPKLEFDVELPTLRGAPSSVLRYDATLKNAGDEDLTVNLDADASDKFKVSFKLTGKEVTSLPLKANKSERLQIEVNPFTGIPAGQYQITVRAQGGEAEASTILTAEVTGQPKLSVTAPEGRLSGQAYAGRETPLTIIMQNTGSAPAHNIELSASPPSSWSVEFDPKQIPELSPDKQVEVTAKIRPADKAVAGDYMVTVRARPEDGTPESAEFRITVLTSTLWGVVGIGLVAVAVIVVGLAVVRFGRR